MGALEAFPGAAFVSCRSFRELHRASEKKKCNIPHVVL